MSKIPPIDDSFIDGVIRSAGPYNPNNKKTQGAKLRELLKLVRDRMEEQVAETKASSQSESSTKADASDVVYKTTQVNGKALSSDISLTSSDVPEGSNLYYSDSRVDSRIEAQKGAANGLADLDEAGKLSTSYLPESILGSVTYKGTYNPATNTPALPSASASKGWYYIITANGTYAEADFRMGDWIISDGAYWQKVDNNNNVTSVAGKVGAVSLVKGDVGLSNVDNTSDVNKPISTAVQAALNLKAIDSNVVHKTGDETISGAKYFRDKLSVLNDINASNIFGNTIKTYNDFKFDAQSHGGFEGFITAPTLTTSTQWRFPNKGGDIALISDLTTKANTNGSNAAGTWGINITGNASSSNLWNGQTYLDTERTAPFNFMVNNNGSWGYSTSDKVKSALGLGSFANKNSIAGSEIDTHINNTPYDIGVASLLRWRNYGDGHAIFDASASIAPNGTQISNKDAQNAWYSTYPTLMGWNGHATYGVRVDSSRVADSATNWGGRQAYFGAPVAAVGAFIATDNADGQIREVTIGAAQSALGLGSAAYLNADVEPTDNTIVKRVGDGLGMVKAGYFYMNKAAIDATTTISDIVTTTGDGVLRRNSANQVKSFLGLGSLAYQDANSFAKSVYKTGTNSLNDLEDNSIGWLDGNIVGFPNANLNWQYIQAGGGGRRFVLASDYSSDGVWYNRVYPGNDGWSGWKRLVFGNELGTNAFQSGYINAEYISGGTEKPNYFGPNKLKLNMLWARDGWMDALWMSSYAGGDVKVSNQLLIGKTQGPLIGFRQQNYDSTEWGNFHEIYHTGNKDLLKSHLGGSAVGGFAYADWISVVGLISDNPSLPYMRQTSTNNIIELVAKGSLGASAYTAETLDSVAVRDNSLHRQINLRTGNTLAYWNADNSVAARADMRNDVLHQYVVRASDGVPLPWKENWWDGSAYHSLSATTTGFLSGSRWKIDGGTGDSYNQATIEVLGNATVRPRIGLHMQGVVASSITIGSDGVIEIANNPGSDYESMRLKSLSATAEVRGNTVYGVNYTAGARVFAGWDAGINGSISTNGWFRSGGNTGWYNEQYGGGIYMEDSTWVRVYNGKAFLVQNEIQGNRVVANEGFKSTTFKGMAGDYDANGATDKIIWTIGDSWNTIGNMYGLGYTYNNIGGYYHTLYLGENGGKSIQLSASTGNAQFNGKVSAGTGTNGGFENAAYVAGHNNIWRLANAAEYGVGYYQGGTDYVGFHFGDRNTPAHKFYNGGNAVFNGSVSASSVNDSGSRVLSQRGQAYYQVDTWLQLNGNHGLYCPSINNAHFAPHTSTTYGIWRIAGSRSSWGGIYDEYSGVNFGMFNSSGGGGNYTESTGKWHFFWDSSSNCLGLGGSATTSGYTAQTNGNHLVTGNLTINGAVSAAGGFYDTSDSRLKTLVDDAFNTRSIKARTYYKNNKLQTGYFAQDVQEIMPHVVNTDNDGYLTLSYNQVLVNKISNLEDDVEAHQKQINELLEIINKLK